MSLALDALAQPRVSLHDYVPGTRYRWEEVLEDPDARFEERVCARVDLERALERIPVGGELVRRVYLEPRYGDYRLDLRSAAQALRLSFATAAALLEHTLQELQGLYDA